MKQYTHSSHGAYSIIAAILMIGFLLILTTSTLNLVLQEMQDGKGRQDYMKAYSAAEGAMELALYHIKEEGYGYDAFIDSIEVFGTENKKAKISYDFDSRVSSYTGSLSPYTTEILPLFWIDTSGIRHDTLYPNFSGSSSDLIWNIITVSGGISGKGNFLSSDFVGEKTFNELLGKISYTSSTKISDFLIGGESYLIVYNASDISQSYTLNISGGEDFTQPKALIYSSAQVGKYTQNIKTSVDNTEFLGILKFSIYSGN